MSLNPSPPRVERPLTDISTGPCEPSETTDAEVLFPATCLSVTSKILRVRVLHPQPHCVVLDPRDTIGMAITYSLDHGPLNPIQAELLGAAAYHDITDIYLTGVSSHVETVASALGINIHLTTY